MPLLGFIAYTAQFSTLFLAPLLLSGLFGTSTFVSGLLIFPGAFLSAVAGRYLGSIITSIETSRTVGIGLVMVLLATVGFSLFAREASTTVQLFGGAFGVALSSASLGW